MANGDHTDPIHSKRYRQMDNPAMKPYPRMASSGYAPRIYPSGINRRPAKAMYLNPAVRACKGPSQSCRLTLRSLRLHLLNSSLYLLPRLNHRMILLRPLPQNLLPGFLQGFPPAKPNTTGRLRLFLSWGELALLFWRLD